jgi:hypothetical protein
LNQQIELAAQIRLLNSTRNMPNASAKLTTPVLFCIFRRSGLVRETFERLRAARPTRLFVHADGPRPSREGEAEECAAARAVTDQIDWPCEVKRLYREENLGCGPAVSSALDWFFSEVEEGIILEDDCLPEPGFFDFAREMLGRYRTEERVMHVAGMGFEPAGLPPGADAFLSPMPFIWGWATWRRAWRRYRYELPLAEEREKVLRQECPTSQMRDYWRRKFAATADGEIRTWDYQWVYTLWQQGGWAVTPTRSLIRNIGFGAESTHTSAAVDGYAPLATGAKTADFTVDELFDRMTLAREIFDRLFEPMEPAPGIERFFWKPPWLRRTFLGIRRRLRDFARSNLSERSKEGSK